MPLRDEEAFKHERAAFDRDMAATRAALEAGDVSKAVDLAVAPAHEYWYGKDPLRFKLFRDLYKLIGDSVDESIYRETPWQAKLLSRLYSVWPKLSLESAILKHDFPESDVNLRLQALETLEIDADTRASVVREIQETKVSGAESVQFAKYSSGLLQERWGVLSRGKYWLKSWNLETGEIIHAEERELPMLASSIARDGSHVLFSYSWTSPGTDEAHWSTSRIETYRRVRLGRAGTFKKSEYKNAKYYKVRGEIVRLGREDTLEMSREDFEANPIRGEVLPSRSFEKTHSPRYREWIREVYSPEEAEEIFREDELAEERERQIVRVKKYQTITVEHEEIEGYLPAQKTTFVAKDGFAERLNVSDVISADRISAKLGVEDGESWIEEIIAPGNGLRSTRSVFTSPVTDVCITSDGSLGLANGLGNSFGIWNLWTAARLREFRGHTGRVTCLAPSIDVSLIASGSEDETVRIWQTFSAECVRVLAGHEHAIAKVCVSLDASKILSADRGGVIKLWDSRTGECLRTISAHTANISGLYFLFDGKFAVSGSWDKTVKVWNLTDGSCIREFEQDDWVTSVDMTPDGRYLASSSYAGTRVWELIWRLEPRDVVEWDARARPALEILMNANAAWEGKLSTPSDMTEEEIKDSLRREGPSWVAWHQPQKKDGWDQVWHLNCDVEETLGYAGYGWLSEVGEESTKTHEEWKRVNQTDKTNEEA